MTSPSYDILRSVVASLGVRLEDDAIAYVDSRVTVGPFGLQANLSKSSTSYDLTSAAAGALSTAAYSAAGWSGANPKLALIVLGLRARVVQPIEDFTVAKAVSAMGIKWQPSGASAQYYDIPVTSGVQAITTSTTTDATTVEAAALAQAGYRHMPPRRPLVVNLEADTFSLQVPDAATLGDNIAVRCMVDVLGVLVRTEAQSFPAREPKAGSIPTAGDIAAMMRGTGR